MKLCKDCKYFKEADIDIGIDTCSHPKLQKEPEPVRGKIEEIFCSTIRNSTLNECGKLGFLWESK